MLASLWTGVAGKLAERWTAAILSPAFVFWAGGALTWAASRNTGSIEVAIDDLTGDLQDLSTATEVAVILAALLLVIASGIVVQGLALGVTRLLEGYWPRPFGGIARLMVVRGSRRRERDAERWRTLALKRRHSPLSPAELDDYARLDRRLRLSPVDPAHRMPTGLGNVLRVAETKPGGRYGLDAIVCWPRLWLLLPEVVQKEVTASRRVLNLHAEIWLWGALFCVWTVFAWWALPLGVVVAVGAYRSMLPAAANFGDLIVASFDLHRFDLYTALRWPLPEQPAAEVASGQALTEYLARGTAPAWVGFTAVEERTGAAGTG